VRLEKDGEGFRIVEKKPLKEAGITKDELSKQFGMKRVLKKTDSSFRLGDYLCHILRIEEVGTFLVIEGESVSKEFVFQTLNIAHPEFITVPFDEL
jgi:adenylate cyclase class IV